MDLETLIQNIENQKFVLVLGPDLAFNFEKSMLKEMSNFLKEKRVNHEFHDEEELFSSSTKFKPFVFQHLPKFFDTLQVTEIYKQIAEIPFHLVINLSPDLMLQQAFETAQFDYSGSTYIKEMAAQDVEKPTKDKPLIYNLLGNNKQNSSLVLCFNHLFEYLSSILGKFELPFNLRSELDEALNIFFLGFKYDKWYFKLIMRLLNKDDNVLRQASNKEIENSSEILNFYTSEFGFFFEEELSGTEIIGKIHAHFKSANALRKPMEATIAKDQSTGGNIINVYGSNNTLLQDIQGNINMQK